MEIHQPDALPKGKKDGTDSCIVDMYVALKAVQRLRLSHTMTDYLTTLNLVGSAVERFERELKDKIMRSAP